MKKVFFLQIYRQSDPSDVHPRYEDAIGHASTILKESGIQTNLFRVHHQDQSSIDKIFSSKAAHEEKPDFIISFYDGASVDLAHKVLAHIQNEWNVPVGMAGTLASIVPDTAMSMSGVEVLFLGDYEFSLPAYMQHRHTIEEKNIPGIWLNRNGKIIKQGYVHTIESLDECPLPDRSIFGFHDNTETFTVSAGRGCPHRCGFCPNDKLRSFSENHNRFVRFRSPDHICDEIDEICMTFPETSMIEFSDHSFTHDTDWLTDFVTTYENRCGISFSCHVRANTFTEEKAKLLRQAGCVQAELHVINGSSFVRNEILEMDTTDDELIQTASLLKKYNIKIKTVNFVGAPYSNTVCEEKTIHINNHIKPEYVDLRVYYPFAGTKARSIARENDWLSNQSESCYSIKKSVLQMKRISQSEITRIYQVMNQKLNAKSKMSKYIKSFSTYKLWQQLTQFVATSVQKFKQKQAQRSTKC